MKLGKKLWLFVYYVEQIDNKQWMVKEAATLNGGVESKTGSDNIRKRIQEQWNRFVCFFYLVSEE